MDAFASAPPGTFAGVRFVLTDMDETLTFQGRLAARTYAALEHLQQAGLRVIPVTAAPAGWCDQMARMWPVDGVIAENGGLFIRRDKSGHGVEKIFWREDVPSAAEHLALLSERILKDLPFACLADDQPFRLTSIAFARPQTREEENRIVDALRAGGAGFTVNNLWVLGWLGDYDKRAMARRVLSQAYGLAPEQQREQVLYSGDSLNDAPMFESFPHSVGVSSLRAVAADMPHLPAWITQGAGGNGFVEIAERVLSYAREGRRV